MDSKIAQDLFLKLNKAIDIVQALKNILGKEDANHCLTLNGKKNKKPNICIGRTKFKPLIDFDWFKDYRNEKEADIISKFGPPFANHQVWLKKIILYLN